MSLSESMHELAKVLVSMPSDLKVEVTIHTTVHDDVPPMFVENGKYFTRVIDTRDGMVTKSIDLYIAD